MSKYTILTTVPKDISEVSRGKNKTEGTMETLEEQLPSESGHWASSFTQLPLSPWDKLLKPVV